MSARLGLQRAKGANDALTSMGLPALLLDESGTVVEANRLIEEWANRYSGGREIASRDGWTRQRIVVDGSGALGKDPDAAVRSFPLRDTYDRASMVVHLIPVRRRFTTSSPAATRCWC